MPDWMLYALTAVAVVLGVLGLAAGAIGGADA
jgi:hypothetical protein